MFCVSICADGSNCSVKRALQWLLYSARLVRIWSARDLDWIQLSFWFKKIQTNSQNLPVFHRLKRRVSWSGEAFAVSTGAEQGMALEQQEWEMPLVPAVKLSRQKLPQKKGSSPRQRSLAVLCPVCEPLWKHFLSCSSLQTIHYAPWIAVMELCFLAFSTTACFSTCLPFSVSCWHCILNSQPLTHMHWIFSLAGGGAAQWDPCSESSIATCWSTAYASQFSHPHPSPWDFSAHLLPSSCTQHGLQSVVEYLGLRPCSVQEDSSWLVLILLPVKSVAFWLLWSSSAEMSCFLPTHMTLLSAFCLHIKERAKKNLLMFFENIARYSHENTISFAQALVHTDFHDFQDWLF